MSFVSWQYAFFLAAMVGLYWQLPWRGRIVLLLAGSYVFYGTWDARFLALLLASTTIDFFCGLAMVRERPGTLKVFFTASLPAIWLAGYTAVPGRRMLVRPMSRLPPSTDAMVQNGITHSNPVLLIGVQVLPSSVECDCCILRSGPLPAKTNSRVTPCRSVSR